MFSLWFEEPRLLCGIAKKHPPQNIKDAKIFFETLEKLLNGKKYCFLMDLTQFQLPIKEVRDYGAKIMPGLISAFALISGSALGKMAANIFFSLKKQPYHVKAFNTEAEARLWLKNYCTHE